MSDKPGRTEESPELSVRRQPSAGHLALKEGLETKKNDAWAKPRGPFVSEEITSGSSVSSSHQQREGTPSRVPTGSLSLEPKAQRALRARTSQKEDGGLSKGEGPDSEMGKLRLEVTQKLSVVCFRLARECNQLLSISGETRARR